LDEFPARHDPEPDSPPAVWRRAVTAIVVVGILGTLATLYFYGFSRSSATGEEPAVMLPAPTDTEVDVATDEADPVPEPVEPEAAAVVPAPPVAAVAAAEPGTRDAPARSGRITVRSSPDGALVTIDGTLAGTTPTTLEDVPFGVHQLQVARPGYVPAVERVELDQAASTRTITVTLLRGEPSTGPTTGSLEVDSRPRGATVLVDGRRVGTTPTRLADVTAGNHDVRIELPGYRTVRAEVTVERGRTARLAVTLEAGR